jgi:glycosyltransferase involved in cell wall biosynthesis
VVAKNEEKNIERCLKSIVQAMEGQNISHEIVLVDSFSTDRTVEIVKEYPVKIFQIPEDVFKSAPAGKYVGIMKSNGKFIQLIDADMTIDEKWIPLSLSLLKKSATNVLGVFGYCTQEEYKNELSKDYSKMFQTTKVENEKEKYRFVGGILFKGTIREMDNINPFLSAEEEEEIYPKLKARGIRLVYQDIEMVHHYGADDEDQKTMDRRFNILWRAQGYILKIALHNKPIRSYWLPKYKSFLAYSIGFLSVLIILLLGLVLVNTPLLIIGIIPVLGWLAYKIIRKRSITHIFRWYFSTLSGFLQKYRTGKDYPLNRVIEIHQRDKARTKESGGL